MDLCNTDAADDPGWGDSDGHFLRKHKYKKVPYRIPVWICIDETVSCLYDMDIPNPLTENNLFLPAGDFSFLNFIQTL